MKATTSFVHAWADRYEERIGSKEPQLLGEVDPTVRARGFYEPDEFAAVARWKTPRSRQRITSNLGSDVREITRMAFSAPESLQHRALTLLAGVSDRHMIVDFRTTEALKRLGEWDGNGGYSSTSASAEYSPAGSK